MLELGSRFGRRIVCELTGMEQPLGRAVGNAIEIREALATLRGGGPPDFQELVLRSAGTLLALSDLDIDEAEGRRLAEAAITSGDAVDAYERWIRAQGGDPSEDVLPTAPIVRPVPSPATGTVESIAAAGIGRAAMRLGAGRARKSDAIDHATGIVCVAKVGDAVAAGEPLAEVHARHETGIEAAVSEVHACYRLVDGPVTPPTLVLEVMS
jgi:thymidine phosphorylase